MSMSFISYLFDVGFNGVIKLHRFLIFKVFIKISSSIIDLNFAAFDDEIFSFET